MAYYIILDNNVYSAQTEEALRSQFPESEILELPSDYERGKYIVVNGELVLNPNWDQQILEEAKRIKFQEANDKAKEYIDSGNALYEFEPGKHIEATDGNIAKLGLSLVNFILTQDYTSTIEWNTKENENVSLNCAQLQVIVAGLRQIQEVIWTVKFPAYNEAIQNAQTAEEAQ